MGVLGSVGKCVEASIRVLGSVGKCVEASISVGECREVR